jgi:Gpi18-like mannosyltransferase
MQDIRKARIEIGLLFLLLVIIVPRLSMRFDFEYWTDWALYIHNHGVTNIYNNPTANYHPFYFYIIWIYDLVQGSEFYIRENIYYLKFFPLIFDFLPIVALCCFRQTLVNEKIPYLYILLNIAYLFNSYIWGQVDSIYTSLSFLALICAFNKPVLSAFLFAMAMAMKPQPIVYIPVLGLAWLYSVKNAKTWVLMILVIAATWLAMAMPYIVTGNGKTLWHILITPVGRYPQVAIGAFNIWYVLPVHDPYHTPDYTKFILLTYKQWGLLMFFIASGLALLPMLFRILRYRIRKETIINDDKQMLMLVSGLVTLYFFYFNSQMHERYAHPIIIFFFFFSVFSKDYKLYILASIPYFLSLDKLFPDFLPVVHYKIIWAMRVIALWYTLTVIYASWEYFRRYTIRGEYRRLKQAWADAK